MRFAINATCCAIMVATTIWNLSNSQWENALLTTVVAAFTGFNAFVDHKIRGL